MRPNGPLLHAEVTSLSTIIMGVWGGGVEGGFAIDHYFCNRGFAIDHYFIDDLRAIENIFNKINFWYKNEIPCGCVFPDILYFQIPCVFPDIKKKKKCVSDNRTFQCNYYIQQDNFHNYIFVWYV